jgi:hypothetical protein
VGVFKRIDKGLGQGPQGCGEHFMALIDFIINMLSEPP